MKTTEDTEDTEDTEKENDLQCELAAWELLREAREQNAKLLSIAERAIDDLRWFYESKADGVILELEQLKAVAK